MGWTEQTFALNDGYQDDEGFLRDLLEDMDRGAGLLLGEMERGGRCVFQVFTATDRGMHCFYRYYDPEHPAYVAGRMEALGDPIAQLFARLDQIVGDVLGRLEAGRRPARLLRSRLRELALGGQRQPVAASSRAT